MASRSGSNAKGDRRRSDVELRAERDLQRRRRIRSDLERRGVAGEFSDAICDRLVPFSEDLPPELYDAVLSGVAMAFGVQRRGVEPVREGAREIAEAERLLGSFVGELRKLDESLETLAAYVSRLRDNVRPEPGGTLH